MAALEAPQLTAVLVPRKARQACAEGTRWPVWEKRWETTEMQACHLAAHWPASHRRQQPYLLAVCFPSQRSGMAQMICF